MFKNTTPKQFLLIDGIGALVTIFFLGIVLVHYEPYFGMPKTILYGLVVAPGIFALYSFSGYFFLKSTWAKYLRVVALGNLAYCVATSYLIFCYYANLTSLGLLYFIGEILVILILVWFEWRSTTSKS